MRRGLCRPGVSFVTLNARNISAIMRRGAVYGYRFGSVRRRAKIFDAISV